MGFNNLGCAAAFLMLGCLIAVDEAKANVVVQNENDSVVFNSEGASFTPRVRVSEICGILLSGKPFDACLPLSSEGTASTNSSCSYFVLISRGNCSFDTKVRHAQDAGFSAVIVSDKVENSDLVTMAGNSRGILIPAVFISKASGDVIFQYANDSGRTECCILPSFGNNAWLITVISLISLLSITVVFAMCFIIWQSRRRRSRTRRRRNSCVVSYRSVRAMPIVAYRSKCDGHGAAESCAICLEDYMDGVKLRILPCCHRFHSSCIDAWLTTWQSFCPVCKHDARVSDVPMSENTPLLASSGSPYQASLPFDEATVISLPESAFEQPMDSTNSNCSSLLEHQNAHFSFSQLPLRSNAASIETPYPFQNRSLQSLGFHGSTAHHIYDSLEAFRASPYFSPPSLAHNSAPNILGSLVSPSMDAQDASLNYNSFLESHSSTSPRDSRSNSPDVLYDS